MSGEALPADSRCIVGRKETLKAISAGDAKVVFIARDAESKITEEVRYLCLKKGIKLKDVETMRQLGQRCGIEIGAAVAALVD